MIARIGLRMVTIHRARTIQRDVEFWFLDENRRATSEPGGDTRAASAPVEGGRESFPLNGYSE